MPEVVEELRALARDLLANGEVKTVIGYKAERLANRASPVIITSPERAGELVWNKFCLNNLAVYLTRAEVMKRGKAAIVVKGCDAKAVCGLLQEGQVARENVVIIGMACDGVGEPTLEMCKSCDVHTPKLADHVIGKAAAADARSLARCPRSRRSRALGGAAARGTLEILAGEIRPLRQMLRLPASLPAVLLQTLRGGKESAAVDRHQRA